MGIKQIIIFCLTLSCGGVVYVSGGDNNGEQEKVKTIQEQTSLSLHTIYFSNKDSLTYLGKVIINQKNVCEKTNLVEFFDLSIGQEVEFSLNDNVFSCELEDNDGTLGCAGDGWAIDLLNPNGEKDPSIVFSSNGLRLSDDVESRFLLNGVTASQNFITIDGLYSGFVDAKLFDVSFAKSSYDSNQYGWSQGMVYIEGVLTPAGCETLKFAPEVGGEILVGGYSYSIDKSCFQQDDLSYSCNKNLGDYSVVFSYRSSGRFWFYVWDTVDHGDLCGQEIGFRIGDQFGLTINGCD